MDSSSLLRTATLIVCWTLFTSSPIVTAQSPPRLSPTASKIETLRAIREGESVTFTCPIERQRNAELFYEWLKDGRQIDMLDDRIRNKGSSLKIKEVALQDDGQYQCNAVNGFGSVSFDFHLVVLSGGVENEPDYNYNGNETEVSEPFVAAKIIGKFPATNRPIRKSTGSRIEFKCEAIGTPTPSIIWLHDNKKLIMGDSIKEGDNVGGEGEEGDEEDEDDEEEDEMGEEDMGNDGERKVTGRWTLAIDPIAQESQGNYTCIVWNSVGSPTSATFNLKVEQANDNVQFRSSVGTRAQVIAIEPPNATLVEGSSTTLTCHVSSQANDPVTIQWFKRLSESERQATPEDKLIQVHLGSGTVNGAGIGIDQGPDYFRLLKTAQNVRSQVIDGQLFDKMSGLNSESGSFEAGLRRSPTPRLLHYTSEIHFNQLISSSAGEYFCLATNSMGYSFKSAWLRVIHQHVEHNEADIPMQKSGSTSITSLSTLSTKATPRNEISLPLLIAATCMASILAIVMMVLLVQCHRRWRRNNDRCLKPHVHHSPHHHPSTNHTQHHHQFKGTTNQPNHQSLSSGSSGTRHREEDDHEEFGSDEASHLKSTPQHHPNNQSYPPHPPQHFRRPNPRLSHHPLIAQHEARTVPNGGGTGQHALLGQGPYPSTASNGQVPAMSPTMNGHMMPHNQQQQQQANNNGFPAREYHYIQLPSRTPYGYLC